MELIVASLKLSSVVSAPLNITLGMIFLYAILGWRYAILRVLWLRDLTIASS